MKEGNSQLHCRLGSACLKHDIDAFLANFSEDRTCHGIVPSQQVNLNLAFLSERGLGRDEACVGGI